MSLWDNTSGDAATIVTGLYSGCRLYGRPFSDRGGDLVHGPVAPRRWLGSARRWLGSCGRQHGPGRAVRPRRALHRQGRLHQQRTRSPRSVDAAAAAPAGAASRRPIKPGGHAGPLRARRGQRRPWRPGLARPEEHAARSEEHTSELQSRRDLVCRLLLEKKKKKYIQLLCAQKEKKKKKRLSHDNKT